MSHSKTPHAVSVQAHDFLDAMLREGWAPTLGMLLALAPDEPLGSPEGFIMVREPGAGWVVGERQRWPKSVLALRRRFPGYQPGYSFQENMRYGQIPAADAPLKEWVVVLIRHAKVAWFRAIATKRTEKQFVDYLREYLGDDLRCWRGGELDKANQILRIAYGMSRFPRTRGARR